MFPPPFETECVLPYHLEVACHLEVVGQLEVAFRLFLEFSFIPKCIYYLFIYFLCNTYDLVETRMWVS